MTNTAGTVAVSMPPNTPVPTARRLFIVALLKAAVPVGAIVADRIDPEQAQSDNLPRNLPRIEVRQSTGRQVYGLARRSFWRLLLRGLGRDASTQAINLPLLTLP